MDPHGHNPPPPRPPMMVRGGPPLPYGAVQYQPNPMAGNQITGSIGGVIPSSTLANSQLAQSANNQLAEQQAAAYQELQQQQQQQLQLQLQAFWANQRQEIDDTIDFKNHSLPLARIKKIMKADEDVRMISAEAPVVFARACEMFILELTMRAWSHTEENKRRTLQKNDIGAAIARTEVFDFLIENNPREDKGEVVQSSSSSSSPSIPRRGAVPIAGPSDALPPYWNMPPQHHLPPVGIPGMMMGSPMPDPTGMYAVQSPINPYMAQQMWQPPPDQQQLPPDL